MDKAIGVFDSGIGGLTVVKELFKLLPHEDIVKVYVKLTSLRHALTKNMQKEI